MFCFVLLPGLLLNVYYKPNPNQYWKFHTHNDKASMLPTSSLALSFSFTDCFLMHPAFHLHSCSCDDVIKMESGASHTESHHLKAPSVTHKAKRASNSMLLSVMVLRFALRLHSFSYFLPTCFHDCFAQTTSNNSSYREFDWPRIQCINESFTLTMTKLACYPPVRLHSSRFHSVSFCILLCSH